MASMRQGARQQQALVALTGAQLAARACMNSRMFGALRPAAGIDGRECCGCGGLIGSHMLFGVC